MTESQQRGESEMIGAWLALPLPALFAVMTAFFAGTAVLLVLLSHVLPTRGPLRSFKGVVGPFIGTVAVIFAILLGFLANDIWDRERRAAAAVRTEAENLMSISTLAETFGLPRQPLANAIGTYAETAVKDEWPSMEHGESAASAERALDLLLKTIAKLDLAAVPGNADLHRLLLNAGLGVRAARAERLRLSRDGSEVLKWALVLALAVTSQITVATVHLDTIRPQIAALTLWTMSLIFVIGLLAIYEQPFASASGIGPAPLVRVADYFAPGHRE